MARRRVAAKREIAPDPVHGDETVAKFINCVMKSGKKSVAEKIVYGALEEILKRHSRKASPAKKDKDEGDSDAGSSGASGLDIFFKAIDNVSPTVEVRARRVGGSTYQIPVEVRPARKLALAMRWIIESALARNGEKSMDKRLAAEIIDAAESRGGAFKKREEMHRMAKSNQAFAHIRV